MSACAGVTVVVDSHPGVREVCDPAGGGQDAATLFARNGWKLTPVSSSPGFVCRVNGQPVDVSCAQPPPASAYWSLWISTGPGQPWTYASLGAYSLTVPKGGAVAFSWDDRPGNVPPSVAPSGATARPDASAGGSATAGAGASASAGPGASASAGAGTSAATSPSAGAPATHAGLPGWVAPGVIGVLLLTAAVLALMRRRRS